MGFSVYNRGGETLHPFLAEPCEPGQILTEAALIVGLRVDLGVAFCLPFFDDTVNPQKSAGRCPFG